MYANGVHFINIISRKIKFMTAEQTSNSESKMLKNSIKRVNHIYMRCGFKESNILMNDKFECICGDLVELQIHFNV